MAARWGARTLRILRHRGERIERSLEVVDTQNRKLSGRVCQPLSERVNEVQSESGMIDVDRNPSAVQDEGVDARGQIHVPEKVVGKRSGHAESGREGESDDGGGSDGVPADGAVSEGLPQAPRSDLNGTAPDLYLLGFRRIKSNAPDARSSALDEHWWRS
jgi:hypothetical protein